MTDGECEATREAHDRRGGERRREETYDSEEEGRGGSHTKPPIMMQRDVPQPVPDKF